MRLLRRNRSGNARPTLGRVLQRVHLGLALIAVGTAGIFLTLVALFALRAYANHNLHLIARSISYTVEAAVVFEDRTAAREALMLIASNEEVWYSPATGRHYRRRSTECGCGRTADRPTPDSWCRW